MLQATGGIIVVVLTVLVCVLAVTWVVDSLKSGRKITDAAQSTVDDLAAKIIVDIGERLDSLKELDDLVVKRSQLEAEVARLTHERTQITEQFERTRRDIEHEAGLLRKQLDHELLVAQATAKLDADKRVMEAEWKFGREALDQEREAFEERITFVEKYTEKLMDLVPKVEALVKVKQQGR